MRLATTLFRTGVGLLLGAGVGGRVEPYLPAVVDAPANLLVVDGFINGNGRMRILLSRTISVNATSAPPPETKATLSLFTKAGQRYALRETSPGRYQSDSLLLDPARRYQLRIVSATGVIYESGLVPLKVTPVIDRVHWQLVNGQVRFLLCTHDAQQQARYYRWGLTETSYGVATQHFAFYACRATTRRKVLRRYPVHQL